MGGLVRPRESQTRVALVIMRLSAYNREIRDGRVTLVDGQNLG